MPKQGENGISWCDRTWNPIRGCSRVSQGCVNCYAEDVAHRFNKPGLAYEGLTDHNGRWNGVIRVVEEHMLDPLIWEWRMTAGSDNIINYGAISDILRVFVLKEEGGVYCDTDTRIAPGLPRKDAAGAH